MAKRFGLRTIGAAAGVAAAALSALPASAQEDRSVYEDLDGAPEAQGPGQGLLNRGGVNLDLRVRYMTDHVFRGIDRSEPGGGFRDEEGNPVAFAAEDDDEEGGEDAPNVQFDGRVEFDLGRLPHPFFGAFVNVYDDDPVSRFQEIRPVVGLEWTVRPLTLAGGHTSYIFPDREDVDTAEVWASVTLDDSLLWGTDRPVLNPYVFAAYDYDLYDGLYVEAGLRHVLPIEDTGITLTFLGNVAYVVDHPAFTADDPEESTGFQHYEVGVVGAYSLNTLLNIPRRYGEFDLEGYFFYTDNIDDDLQAETQLWGGVGVGFRY